MKTSAKPTIAIAVVALALAVSVPAAESVSVLLQKAIYAEETEGNLDAAIKIYEGIVKEGEASRSLLAQALYRLGTCELKRGHQEEAETAFRKVLTEFAGDAEVQAKARDRLVAMGKSLSSVVVRQIWSDPQASGDAISRDGRYLGFIDWNSGNLVVRDLAEKRNRPLTAQASFASPTQYAWSCAFSPDSKHAAFNWFCRLPNETNSSSALYVANLADSSKRVLIPPNTNLTAMSVQDWSPDGRLIAIVNPFAVVSAEDGSIQTLRAPPGPPSMVRFSPDGRFLAYNVRVNAHLTRVPETNDIYVLEMQSGIAKRVIEHWSQESLLGWAPRGSEIIFSSKQEGGMALLKLEVGRAGDWPKVITTIADSTLPIGICGQGSLYYMTQLDQRNVYVASIDLVTGKLVSSPKELPRRVAAGGSKFLVDVSPNARQLLFRKFEPKNVFQFEDVEKGRGPDISIHGDIVVGSGLPRPVWSPDGRYFAFRGWTNISAQERLHRIHVLDGIAGEDIIAATSEPKENTGYWGLRIHNGILSYVESVGTRNPETQKWNGDLKISFVRHDLATRERQSQAITHFSDSIWRYGFTTSHNESELFYVRVDQQPPVINSVAIYRNLATGQELNLFQSTNKLLFLGQPTSSRPVVIAVVDDQGHPRVWHCIKGVEVSESGAKERFSTELSALFQPVQRRWTGSDTHLLLTKRIPGRNGATELWTLAASTGELRKTELAMPRMQVLGYGPGGQVFFQKGEDRQAEIWVMENFLPPVASAK